MKKATAFWGLFIMTLMAIYDKRYQLATAFGPVWFCFLSLMLATPIAFAFRYVFVMALLFPFLLLMPFIYRKTERFSYDIISK